MAIFGKAFKWVRSRRARKIKELEDRLQYLITCRPYFETLSGMRSNEREIERIKMVLAKKRT